MTLKNYSTAESMFNLLISQHDYSPFLPDSYLKLGLINYTQHKDDVALGYYKTVVERFPKTNASNEALTFIEIIYLKRSFSLKLEIHSQNKVSSKIFKIKVEKVIRRITRFLRFFIRNLIRFHLQNNVSRA